MLEKKNSLGRMSPGRARYWPSRRFFSENGLPPQKKIAKPQNLRSASQKKIEDVERLICHLLKLTDEKSR
jgi:hypothetical protein